MEHILVDSPLQETVIKTPTRQHTLATHKHPQVTDRTPTPNKVEALARFHVEQINQRTISTKLRP